MGYVFAFDIYRLVGQQMQTPDGQFTGIHPSVLNVETCPPPRTRTGIEAILPLKQEGQTVQHFFNSYTTFSVGERWLSSSAYRNQVSSDWFRYVARDFSKQPDLELKIP